MITKATLRQKKIGKGRLSLYLDFYPAITNPKTGTPTRREFLNIYILEKPRTALEKQNNADQLRLAEHIRQKRENLLNKPEIYSQYEQEQLRIKELGEQCFIQYFKKLADKRTDGNRDSWLTTLKYLEQFTNGTLKFADVTETLIESFKEYLLGAKKLRSTGVKLSQNSAQGYFNKVKATLKQAYKDGLLQTDINSKITPIKTAETQREYLSIEELNSLVTTPCPNDLIKRASLFSALTGLRFSDIAKMTWQEVTHVQEQGYFLNFQQQKTKGIEVLPISEQAYQLLGTPQDPKQQVFKGLYYSAHTNKALHQWIKDAGITRKITFHCFRHTYATLQLFSGTDIYTISKMLGHRELKTTQIYAKVVDEAKRQAVNKIKLNF